MINLFLQAGAESCWKFHTIEQLSFFFFLNSFRKSFLVTEMQVSEHTVRDSPAMTEAEQ